MSERFVCRTRHTYTYSSKYSLCSAVLRDSVLLWYAVSLRYANDGNKDGIYTTTKTVRLSVTEVVGDGGRG